MAGKARVTFVLISADARMLLLHDSLVVLMASKAGEYFVVGGIRMAGCAIVPRITMFAAVNGKMRRVVFKCCRLPA